MSLILISVQKQKEYDFYKTKYWLDNIFKDFLQLEFVDELINLLYYEEEQTT